jgi:hypothetical protein
MKVLLVRVSIVALLASAIVVTAYSSALEDAESAESASSEPTVSAKACHFAQKGICMEYTGAGFNAPEIAPTISDDCRQNGGEILETGCRIPTPVGFCTIDPSTDSETRSQIYAPINTADSGQKLCEESGGIWSTS